MFELDGRVGIVTGASSGIGLATAQVLAQAGAKVYSISRTGKPKDDNYESHPNVVHLKGDITDFDAMEQIVKELGEKEGIDFLINNAGVSVKKRAEEITQEEFEWVMSVNVNSVYRLSCMCYPYLKQSGHVGRIVTISSMAAHLGFNQVVPYCTSKAAVLGLTRGLAVEWANDNVTVNSVAPGWFPSELAAKMINEERKKQILNRMPVHKFGNTKDLGAMIQFLLSDSAAYITGQDFAVDGGALAFGF